MSRNRVPRSGPGRPRTRPLAVLADRAYSSRAIRSHLRRRGIRACGHPPAVRPPSTARSTSSETPSNGASIASSSGAAWPHEPDKLVIAYQAALHLAGILIWTRR
jgi:hypothetical protein